MSQLFGRKPKTWMKDGVLFKQEHEKDRIYSWGEGWTIRLGSIPQSAKAICFSTTVADYLVDKMTAFTKGQEKSLVSGESKLFIPLELFKITAKKKVKEKSVVEKSKEKSSAQRLEEAFQIFGSTMKDCYEKGFAQDQKLFMEISGALSELKERAKKWVAVVAIMLLCSQAYAMSDAEAIRCVMGEARNQDYTTQVATAEALRNRGTTDGVYGCSDDFTEPVKVWKIAERAWYESATTNLTNGADSWESTDFPTPYWAKGKKILAHFGKHLFYRVKKSEAKEKV